MACSQLQNFYFGLEIAQAFFPIFVFVQEDVLERLSSGFLGYPLCSLLLCVLYISDDLSFRIFFNIHSFFREVLIPVFDMVCFIFFAFLF